MTVAPSYVNGTDVTVVYGEDIIVTVASLNATNVTYNITNAVTGVLVVADTTMVANGTIEGLDLAVGNYTVSYVTVVDANHTFAYNSSKIFVTVAPSAVSAENVTKVYSEQIVVNVVSVNATNVTYVIEGTGLSGLVADDGTITIDDDLDVGEYIVTLTTHVDGNHESATSTSKITVTPAPSAVSAENVTIYYGENAVLTASGENSTGINKTSVVVLDANDKIVDATVKVENFTITISGLDVGNYTVGYTNKVDKNHNTASNVTGIVVLELNTTVSNESAIGKPGKTVSVDFTVKDQNNNDVSGGTLTVTVEGKEYTANVKNGKATFKIVLPDTPGDYNGYEVSYSGTKDYNPSVGQLNLTVQKVDVIVSLPEVINYTGAVVDIVVNVTDEFGYNVTNGTVTLTIDWGTKLSEALMATAETHTVEVSNGTATFKGITLGDPGKYPSKAEYTGNDYYNDAEDNSDVIVLPLNTTTKSDDVSGKSGDKVDITADITDQNGNPVKNGTAVLKVNGKKYYAKVVEGKAIFEDVELPSESTDATIDYLGNDYYNPSSTTIHINIEDEPEPEPQPEPTPAKKVTVKGPVAGNPIAMLLLVLLTLVSTISIRRQNK